MKEWRKVNRFERGFSMKEVVISKMKQLFTSEGAGGKAVDLTVNLP